MTPDTWPFINWSILINSHYFRQSNLALLLTRPKRLMAHVKLVIIDVIWWFLLDWSCTGLPAVRETGKSPWISETSLPAREKSGNFFFHLINHLKCVYSMQKRLFSMRSAISIFCFRFLVSVVNKLVLTKHCCFVIILSFGMLERVTV